MGQGHEILWAHGRVKSMEPHLMYACNTCAIFEAQVLPLGHVHCACSNASTYVMPCATSASNEPWKSSHWNLTHQELQMKHFTVLKGCHTRSRP